MNEKFCKGCELNKNTQDFHIDHKFKDGRNPICKSCVLIRRKKRYKNKVYVTNKICTNCKINTDISLFRKHSYSYDGYSNFCKKCYKEKYVSEEYRDKYRYKKIKRIYDISKEEYEDINKKQNGLCVICNKKDRLNIDHCHKTNKIRGLLCGKCNKGLGIFNDNIGLLIKAAHYINDHI